MKLSETILEIVNPLPVRSIVTLGRLNRALFRVNTELERHGLWNERLASVDVFLVPWSWFCYGWQWYGSTGEICIPAVSVAKCCDAIWGTHKSLADVVRHEYGHALADTHRGLFRSRQFSNVFGASHEDDSAFEYDPDFHVSNYASTDASEDFAETFMLYLRHGGRLPNWHRTPAKLAKWRFIRQLSVAVQSRRRRW